jgi:preprotein translocase subunit SecD
VALYDWEASLVGSLRVPVDRQVARRRARAASFATVVVRAPRRNGWYVLRDRPGLRGDRLRHAEQNFDQSPAGSFAPVLIVEFMTGGGDAFRRLVEEVVRRSRELGRTQHVALVVDGKAVSVTPVRITPYSQHLMAENSAQFEGAFTIDKAQRLADQLTKEVARGR